MSEPSVKEILESLTFDAQAGEFRWARNVSRKARRGSLAGSVKPSGYCAIRIMGRAFYAHRLAWLFVHGEWPSGHIDHVNGIRSDNRISNLRAASAAENRQNIRGPASNNLTSGVLGVNWHKASGKWRAAIGLNNRHVHIGCFESIEQAEAAYLSAKQSLHPFSVNAGEKA